MPILKKRHSHTKVFRPNGTKFAEGRDASYAEAIRLAERAFMEEFGYRPFQSNMIIEVVGVTGAWYAQVFEVIDNDD